MEWSAAEIEILKNNFHNHKNRELSELLNRSESSIECKAKRLNLLKDNSVDDYKVFSGVR